VTTSSASLSELIRQGPAVRPVSKLAYFATSLTDVLISGGPLVILLLTFWSSQQPIHLHSRFVNAALIGAALVYLGYFGLRLALRPEWRSRLYTPRVQWFRCQIGIVGVTLLIGLLATRSAVDNELWLLYVLATISLSAHSTTKILMATLLEVTGLYVSATMVGLLFAMVRRGYAVSFLAALPDMLVCIVWMWLLTFLLHSLVRTVQFRDELSSQQQSWLTLVEDNVVAWEQPEEQREALARSVERLTASQVELWLPRLVDGCLANRQGAAPPPHVAAAAATRVPTIAVRASHAPHLLDWLDGRLGQRWHVRPSQLWAMLDEPSALAGSGDVQVLDEPPADEDTAAEIILPICRLDPGQELLGLLHLRYTGGAQPLYQLIRYAAMLRSFTGPARVILAVSQQHERQQRVDRLAPPLDGLLSTQAVADQVVQGLVDDWGFDFATFSVVDTRLNLIRSIAGCRADWVDMSQHPLAEDDVQSLTVRTGQVHHNDGEWEPCLDKRIWRKYRHWELTRVWVPIAPGKPTAPDAAPGAVIGTLEAGFYRTRVASVSPTQTALLQELAGQIYVALVNALRLERQRELTDALALLNATSDKFSHISDLTTLQEASQRIRDVAGIYDADRVARMIGENAETILKGDIVMVYGWEEAREHLDLLYMTPKPSIRGKGELVVRITEDGVLNTLYSTRQSYFSAHAEQDALLVNADPASRQRTFTQRQNVKSFVGLPLLGRNERLVGFLCVNYRSRREFHDEERRLLEVFARQAAIALEEARSQRLVERQVVAQERGRLAAHLHDSLSQNLFWLRQYASTALVYAQRDDRDHTLLNLNKVSDLASTSLQAFGEMLRELREGQSEQTDFVSELQETLERLKVMDSFSAVRFEHPNVDGKLPAAVQFYLLRIAREALFNAARHARGARVHVVYNVERDGAASLAVTDDGPGFDLEEVRRTNRHSGLDAIEYYASRINARPEIRAGRGHGVTVRVRVHWPLEEERNAQSPERAR
jgi:signal transduction histidine kinase